MYNRECCIQNGYMLVEVNDKNSMNIMYGKNHAKLGNFSSSHRHHHTLLMYILKSQHEL